MRPYRGLTKEGKWVKGWYFDFDKISYINTNLLLIEVIPKTVGQSTGKFDINKKEIFAGDRIRGMADGDIGVVYWKENVAGFYCLWGDGLNMPLNTGVATYRCEVIGNIHDKEEP